MKDCPICRFFESSSSVQVLGTFGEFSVRHSEAEKRLPGYLYIEPKPHWTSYSDWNPESYSDFGNALRFATNWIYERHSPLKVYTVTVSEMVPHMHFHLIPRYTEDSRGVDYIRLALQGQLPE
ncbi:HIT family hydrolase [Leptospira ellisii]|uniref:HIT family hydrolase n=1 Tax=Leptospira ellisii TaxID=2023197 RepID=A0A2N0B5N4_9LEPT|nr:HIT family hydrolase [Leptospira ellisii]MDV6235054.1 HIT family hydrolase [Leptospira ellisii]PJZ91803.1 HIT family hydrolase [Leptospira ellisii]